MFIKSSNMKQVILFSILVIMFSSCQSQNQTDIENIKINDTLGSLLKNIKKVYEVASIITTLPLVSTYDTKYFKFGSIEFSSFSSNDIRYNEVGVFLNNINERIIKGVYLHFDGTKQSIELFNYLKNKRGNPEVLCAIPKKNKNGQLLGYADYMWNDKVKNYSIFLVHSYEYTDGVKDISTTMCIIDNDIKVARVNDSRTVRELLIQTYTYKYD